MLGQPPAALPTTEPPAALPATEPPAATRRHPPCVPGSYDSELIPGMTFRQRARKSQKKSKIVKKCFTKPVVYEILPLSRGTGPLDKAGIPPARTPKRKAKKDEKSR